MTATDPPLDGAQVAAIVDPYFRRSLDAGSAPGMVYAVVSMGSVIHCRGIGALALPAGRAPDADTVFRIASMTKSFTAMALIGLRDEGLLSLDAPVVAFVPELAAGGEGAQEITVRHLLTMGGGFLTDDPWGDRQQDLPVAGFRRLVGKGLTPLWAPGLRFEYSNLGYALLGLVIEAVAGSPYREVVESRLLEPLGMTSTGYSYPVSAGSTLASGYVRRTDGWVEEPLAASGAFSPMGGLLSTVNDLATWVGVFQSVQTGHPGQVGTLDQASVREMQVTQRLVAATAPASSGAAPEVTGYGFGLFEDFRGWGRSVYHSGGYPGFGSHMRWHPASGLGIVALANGTYAAMSTVATAALGDLVQKVGVSLRTAPLSLPVLDSAQAFVTDWLAANDPEGETSEPVRALCADNVELDVPWPERVAAWHALRRSHGALAMVPDSVGRPSPGSLSWQMCGDGPQKRVRVTVMMAPHDPRLVQAIQIRAIDPKAAEPLASTDWT